MNKEMTTTEINAVAATINHQNLRLRFDYLTDGMENWKMPFGKTIEAKHYDEYNEAAIYFTGAELEITRRFTLAGLQFMDVYCEGYYNAVGA